MSGGSEQTTTTQQQGTSTQSPWAPAVPGIYSLLDAAQGQLGTPIQYYPGQTVSPLHPYQTQGQNQLAGYAQSGAPGIVEAARGPWEQLLDPTYLLQQEGAYAPLNAYSERVGENLRENIFPALDAARIQAGMTGYGSRGELARGVATGRAADAVARAGADLTGDLTRLGTQTSLNALGQAPMMMNLGAMPGRMLSGVGDFYRADEQARLDADRARWDFNQREPWQRLQMGAGLLYPAAQLGGTTETEQTGTSTTRRPMNTLGTIAGLGLAGAGMFGGSGGMAGGLNALGGAFGGPAPSTAFTPSMWAPPPVTPYAGLPGGAWGYM